MPCSMAGHSHRMEFGEERETGGSGSHVDLLIRDNGSGFSSGTSTGIGLTAMRERVLSINGSSDIQRTPAGTVSSVPERLRADGRNAPVADQHAVEGAIE